MKKKEKERKGKERKGDSFVLTLPLGVVGGRMMRGVVLGLETKGC
jgi:hypothetical protein